MISNGEYTTADLREICRFWKENGGIVAPEEVIEMAGVLDYILDAAEEVVSNWAQGDLAGAVHGLEIAIGGTQEQFEIKAK